MLEMLKPIINETLSFGFSISKHVPMYVSGNFLNTAIRLVSKSFKATFGSKKIINKTHENGKTIFP